MRTHVLAAFFDELTKIAVTGTPVPASPSKPPSATASAPKVSGTSQTSVPKVPAPQMPGSQPARSSNVTGARTSLPGMPSFAGKVTGPNPQQAAGKTQVAMIASQQRAGAPKPATPQAQTAPATPQAAAATVSTARAATGPVAGTGRRPMPAMAAPATTGAVATAMPAAVRSNQVPVTQTPRPAPAAGGNVAPKPLARADIPQPLSRTDIPPPFNPLR